MNNHIKPFKINDVITNYWILTVFVSTIIACLKFEMVTSYVVGSTRNNEFKSKSPRYIV